VSAIVGLSAVAVAPVVAQSWPAGTAPVRGVVTSISASALTVRSRTDIVTIHLGSPLKVFTRTPSDLAHVNRNSFVGVTSVKQPDGSERATEIHIFPEELRGVGEGSYMMNPDQATSADRSRMTNGTVSGLGAGNDSTPRSRMTNGTVSTKSGASTLSVEYGGGVELINVPPDVNVTALTLSTDPIRPGDHVVVLAEKQTDGSLMTTRIISIPEGTAK
jgi:hypothetical protein